MKRISLLIFTHEPYFREVTRGAIRYARADTSVELHAITLEGGVDWREWMKRQSADGVVADLRPGQEEVTRALRESGVACVNVWSDLNGPAADGDWCTKVVPDDEAVGALAAEAFLERGFKSLAFFGASEDGPYLFARLAGFRNRAAQAGVTVTELLQGRDSAGNFSGGKERTEAWVRQLARSCGLLLSQDSAIAGVERACRAVGRRIPEDLAIVGVDNDDLICETTIPTLSSVPLDPEGAGYTAMALLMEQLKEGKKPPGRVVKISPRALVHRHSTEVMAVEDTVVRQAIEFVRENVAKAISVDDVASAVAVSRRTLQMRFRSCLRITLSDHIRRSRVERAKILLGHDSLPLRVVSLRSGFSSHTRFGIVFSAVTGMTPSAYRRRLLGGR